MSSKLNKKIIELESRFSLLISKYNNLKLINENLNKEIINKEIDLILYKYNFPNKDKSQSISYHETSNIKDEIDKTINEIDNIINSLKS